MQQFGKKREKLNKKNTVRNQSSLQKLGMGRKLFLAEGLTEASPHLFDVGSFGA